MTKKISFLILAVTAVLCSRAVFFFIDDPEGPNLLVVIALGVIVYSASMVPYFFNFLDRRKSLFSIFIQVAVVTTLYVLSVIGF